MTSAYRASKSGLAAEAHSKVSFPLKPFMFFYLKRGIWILDL
jgi:hypothetical protein